MIPSGSRAARRALVSSIRGASTTSSARSLTTSTNKNAKNGIRQRVRITPVFQGPFGKTWTRTYATRTEVFNLADIGEGIAEVEILAWFVKPGDKIEEFDRLCEVQSDKATVEIKSPFAGVVTKLHHNVGDMAKVRSPLADIQVDGEGDAAPAPTPTAAPPVAQKITGHDDIMNTIQTPAGQRLKVLAAPAVRHMAKANSIDLSLVSGSGRDGRVTKGDVQDFLAGKPLKAAAAEPVRVATYTAVEGDRVEVLKGYKKAMAKKMTEALTIPHFGYCEEIRMDELAQLRKELKSIADVKGIKLSYLPFIIKACSLGLKDHPILNSSINRDLTEITYKASHNIGIAVDTPGGLVVPNIKNVQNLSIFEVAAELNRIIKLASENKLPPSDLQGGTFTLSNIGVIGGTYAKPVLVAPEVCIGALGRIQKLPRFNEHGQVVAAQIMQVSWSCDHRAVDGATIANFTNLLKQYLENPKTMLVSLK